MIGWPAPRVLRTISLVYLLSTGLVGGCTVVDHILLLEEPGRWAPEMRPGLWRKKEKKVARKEVVMTEVMVT